MREEAMIFLVITCLMPPFTLRAQEKGEFKVTGSIRDKEQQEPLPMATAVLLNAEDSSMITGTSANAEGDFIIKAKKGDYLLKARYMGYRSKIIPGIRLGPSEPVRKLGTIALSSAKDTLGEFTVEEERSHITMKEGKKIFNVGTDLSTSGASASDVLNNIPSVSMDIEGSISLRGSQGVRILINGKPSSMMGISGSEALRYFPANQIKEVEVITNPSARYEAQGSAGIINIILKENIDWGLNGTFSLEAGWPHNHGASVNMNYRKKWYNIFGSYTFGYDRAPGGGWREQTFNYPDTTYSLRTDEDQSRGGFNHNLQLGSDFYFTPNDVLKISGVYSLGDERNNTELSFFEYNEGLIQREDLVRRVIRDELEKEKEGDHELNLSYEKTFGKEDHELLVNLQARGSNETEDANLVETAGLPDAPMDTTIHQNSLNSTNVNAYMGKVDYIWPFSEEGKFETGLRAETRSIENLFNVEQRPSPSEPWNTLDQFSNTFFYTEEIYGIYAMYNNSSGDFSYQGGLRFEYTGITTSLKSEEEESERSYYNFFPSLSLSYDISETNSIQVSYSRRLDRPYFRELNPYNTFNNNRNYRTGNSQLDPEFTGAYDLGFVNYREKGSFYFGAFYRRTKNEIEDVDTVNEEGITIVKPYNLSSRQNLGIEARYSMEITDWWNFSISTHFYHGSTSGIAAGEDLNNAAFTMDGRARVDFDVKDWFKIQFNGDYRAPEKEGQDTEKAMYEINAGIRKELFDGKGNVSFSVRDIFNTDIYRSTVDGSNFTARRKFQWRRGPFFSLSFSYELKDKETDKDQERFIGGEGEQ